MTSRDTRPQGLSYRDAGVDVDAGNALVQRIGPLAAATARPGADARLGGFGALFDLKAAGFSDPILVASNDGVGTKLKIAVATDQHDTIGIDLVAMCANDVLVQGAEPLLFLDYFSCGQLDTAIAERVVAGIADGCKQAGCALIGGETAEMPGMYEENEYDLAGFCVGAAERGTLLPKPDVAEGDVLLALASSGPHSNGYSLIRRIVASTGLGYRDPAPFAPQLMLGQVLLTPTRIYAKRVFQVHRDTQAIKAMAHITGGGLTDNVPRALPDHLAARIDLASWRLPPVFAWLQQAGEVAPAEMLRTFNCGIGLVLVVDKMRTVSVLKALRDLGERPIAIGNVVLRAGGDHVRYSGALAA